MKNLIEDPVYKETGKMLKEKMYGKMQEIGDTFENNTWYEMHWIEERRIKRTATLTDENK